MPDENQRIVLTKRLLKEALLRLLIHKNIEKIGVSELCREAGINRATFYRHYEIPNDILKEMQREFIQKVYEFPDFPTTLKESQKYLEHLCIYFSDNIDLLKIFIRNNSDTDFTLAFKDFYQDFLLLKGTIPALEQLDSDSVQLLTSYAAGGGYFLLRRWLMGDIKKTPQELAELMFNLLNLDYRTL